MKATGTLRPALVAGALSVLFTLPGCVVLPFGHDGGEGHGEHGDRGERRSHEKYYPAPDFLPSDDAGDSTEHEFAGLALQFRSAAYRPAG